MQESSQLYANLNFDATQLPTIQKVQYLAPAFTDNTHNIWFLETSEGAQVLKKLNTNIADNPFWQRAKELFGLKITQELTSQQKLAQVLSELSPFIIPPINYAANSQHETAENLQQLSGFLLTTQFEGLAKSNPSCADLAKLIEHLFALETYELKNWGLWHNPKFTLASWGEKLAQDLAKIFADNKYKNYWHLIDKAKKLQPNKASLTMLDLRWDQLLFAKDGKIALVDLDAFVSAPQEMNWIILELIISSKPYGTPTQAKKLQEILDLTKPQLDLAKLQEVRDIYRLWLFSLNILGETDLANWMARPIYF